MNAAYSEGFGAAPALRTAAGMLTAILLSLGLAGPAQAGMVIVFCPGGGTAPTFAQCVKPPTPPTSQSGVTGQTMTNMLLTVGDTIDTLLDSIFRSVVGGGTAGVPGTERAALAGETGAAAAAGGNRWNGWLAHAQINSGYSFQPLQTVARQRLSLAGIDYTFHDSLVAGFVVTDERLRASTAYNGGQLNGGGNTVATYLGWRITPNWRFDATVAAGSSNLSFVDHSVAGGVSGTPKDKHSLVSTGLAYNQTWGSWLLTGKGTLLTANNRISSFTMSNRINVDAVRARTSQVRLLGQASYGAGTVAPFFSIGYVHDLERPHQDPVRGQVPANDRDAWQLRAGLNVRTGGAVYGGVQYLSELGRSQTKTNTLLFNLGVRF